MPTAITQNNIKTAVDAWVNDEGAATATYGHISTWDTSAVTDMSLLFLNKYNFNSDISGWDTSQVTNMFGMFANATDFNQDIGQWNVSDVTNMRQMFLNATAFNQEIRTWKSTIQTSVEVEMMFQGATTFNANTIWNSATGFNANGSHDLTFWTSYITQANITQANIQTAVDLWVSDEGTATATYGHIKDWDTSAVTNMSNLFFSANNFNSDISDWNVSNVTNMNSMFRAARAFNQNIGQWDVSKVEDMGHMFRDANLFNQDINRWDVSKVEDMSLMFISAGSFDQDIQYWNTSSVTDYTNMFHNSTAMLARGLPATPNSSHFNIFRIGDPMTNTIIQTAVDLWVSDEEAATATYGAINTWDTSQVTDMSQLFKNKTNFNSDISGWDVSNVTTMYRMFYYAESFNQDIGNWTIVGDVNMREMFANARVFNQPLADWERTHSTGTTTITVTVVQDGGNKYVLNGNTAVKPVLQVGHTYIFDMSDTSNSNHPLVFHSDQSGTVFNNVTTSGQAGSPGATVTFEPQQTGDVYLYCANHGYGMGSHYNPITVTSSGSTLASVTDMYGMFRGASDFNQDISQWDVSQVTTVERMFQNAIDFDQDIQYWNTSSVTNYDNKFQGATAMLARGFLETPDSSHFNIFRIGDPMTNDNIQTAVDLWVSNQSSATATYGDINTWDTSAVTDMSNLFSTTRNGSMSTFNSNISNWDVSNVTNMLYMFQGAAIFNSDISNWDVSGVTNMAFMFQGAANFNQDITYWDVSSVTSMTRMFNAAEAFDQDIQYWNPSSNTNSYHGYLYMFDGAPDMITRGFHAVSSDYSYFNQVRPFKPTTKQQLIDAVNAFTTSGDTNVYNNVPINDWDTSLITDMSSLFQDKSTFNSNISGWDVSSVSNMEAMFSGANDFNQPLNDWDVSSVTKMRNMFLRARNFNQSLNDWDVSNVNNMRNMFDSANAFNGDISSWTLRSSGLSMQEMFKSASDFNVDITTWDTSGVTTMQDMFKNATDFDQSIQYWKTTHSSFNNMFSGATAMLARGFPASPSSTHFNKFPPMTNDNIQTAVDLWVSNQSSATTTYGDISTWDTSQVTDMSNLFSRNRNSSMETFNSNITNWDVSSVINMSNMFRLTQAFNQDISNWNVSSVENMNAMFMQSTFNINISNWNVSSVENMSHMFRHTQAFNQPIGGWDVSSVTNMGWMFANSREFNQDLSFWDVSNVTSFRSMFENGKYGRLGSTSNPRDPNNTSVSLDGVLIKYWAVSANANLDTIFYNNITQVTMRAGYAAGPYNKWFSTAHLESQANNRPKFNQTRDITDYINAGYTLAQLFTIYTSAQLRSEGYTAEQFFNAQASSSYMKDGFTVSELITVGYQLNSGTNDNMKLLSGFTVSELSSDFTATNMKTASVSATNMKTAFDAGSYTISQITTGGYLLGELLTAAFSVSVLSSQFNVSEMKAASITAANIKLGFDAGNYNISQIKAGAYGITELLNGSFTIVHLTASGGFSVTEMKAASISAVNMKLAFDAGNYTISQIKSGAYGITELLNANFTMTHLSTTEGFTASEMKTANIDGSQVKGFYDIQTLKEANYTISDLFVTNGFSITELSANNSNTGTSFFNVSEMKAASISAVNMKLAFDAGNYTISQIKASYSITELFVTDGFSITELSITDGFSVAQMKAASVSAANIKLAFTAGNYTISQIKASYSITDLFVTDGFSITELSITDGFSVAQMKAASVSAANIKLAFTAGNYTIGQIKTGGYDLVDNDVTARGLLNAFTITELSSEFTILNMFNASVSAANMKQAVTDGTYSIIDLINVGYTLNSSGSQPNNMGLLTSFNVSELRSFFHAGLMRSAGVISTTAKNAGYTLPELKNYYTINELLVPNCFTIVELSASNGFTVSEMHNQDVSTSNIKLAFDAGNYSMSDIKNSYGINELLLNDIFTMTHLTTNGFNTSEMKTAGKTVSDLYNSTTSSYYYTLAQLSSAYTISELTADNIINITQLSAIDSNTGTNFFSVSDMKTASISATNIKLSFNAGHYSIEQIKGSYTITELFVTNGFSITELSSSGGFNVSEMKAASITVANIKLSFNAGHYSIEQIKGSYTITELFVTNGFSITELSSSGGFNVSEMKAASISVANIKIAFDAGNYTIQQIKSNYNVSEIDHAYTISELFVSNGFTILELSSAGGFNVSEMKAASISVANIKIAFDAGNYTIGQIKLHYGINELIVTDGFSMSELSVSGGFSAAEMNAANISAANIKGFYDISILKAGGYTLVDSSVAGRGLLPAFSVAELKNDFSANEMKTAGKVVADLYDSANSTFHYTTQQLSNAYSISELTVDHGVLEILDISPYFSVSQMFTASVSAADIKPSVGNTTGYTITTLKANGYVLVDSSVAGRGLLGPFSVTELKNDFSATEMKTASVSVSDAKAGTYSLAQLKASSYTFTEISSQYTYGDLSAGYTELEMFNENVSAANIRIAIENGTNFTLASVKSLGTYTLVDSSVAARGLLKAFSVTELKDVYTAKEMFDANVSAAHVKTNYSVTILKNTGTYTLVDSNVAARGLLFESAFSVAELKYDFTAKEMFDAQVSAADVKTNYSVTILKNVGTYTLVDSSIPARGLLFESAFSVTELKDDYSATEMQLANVSPNDLKGFYTIVAITSAYGISVLTQQGTSFTLTDFKGQIAISTLKPQYSVAQFKAALYTVGDLLANDDNGNPFFTISELSNNFTVPQFKEFYYQPSQLEGSFSLKRLKDHFSIPELRDGTTYTTNDLLSENIDVPLTVAKRLLSSSDKKASIIAIKNNN